MAKLKKSSSKILNNVADKVEVPKRKIKLLEVARYGELKAPGTVRDGMTMDHIPSRASLVERAEKELGRKLSKSEKEIIKNKGGAIAVSAEDHMKVSRTYGGRNTPELISTDALDPAGAIIRDVDTYVDAGKISAKDAPGIKKALNDLLEPDNLNAAHYKKLLNIVD